MKLIDEKEVEEAAIDCCLRDGYSDTYAAGKKNGFNEGIEFAEQKLRPMMVELIDLIDENEWNNNVTSREKLEQFLKNKQK